MTFNRRQSRRGVATVELAVVTPVLVTFFLGMCEIGASLNATVILQNAAAVGGRLASSGQSTNAQIKQAVLGSITAANLPISNAVVTVSNVTQPAVDVSQASTLDKLQVTATVPFKDVRWGVSGFILQNTALVKGSVTYYSARVNPYPTNILVPAGN